MNAPGRRCSISSEACVRHCRRATSPGKRRRSTRRSPRLREHTGRETLPQPPVRRRPKQPRQQPENRRLQTPPRRPRPRNSPPCSDRARLLRPLRQGVRRDRLLRRLRQHNPRLRRARPFSRLLRSDLSRLRRFGVSLQAGRKPQFCPAERRPPQLRRLRFRRLDPNWRLQWPIRRAAGRLLRSWPRAARMKVCRG